MRKKKRKEKDGEARVKDGPKKVYWENSVWRREMTRAEMAESLPCARKSLWGGSAMSPLYTGSLTPTSKQG